jgi:hypothetical protein
MKLSIQNLIRNKSTGTVVKVCWVAFTDDENDNISTSGVLDLGPKDPSDPSFVNFESLTESQVVQWLEQSLGQSGLAQISNLLNRQLEEKGLLVNGFPNGFLPKKNGDIT